MLIFGISRVLFLIIIFATTVSALMIIKQNKKVTVKAVTFNVFIGCLIFFMPLSVVCGLLPRTGQG